MQQAYVKQILPTACWWERDGTGVCLNFILLE